MSDGRFRAPEKDAAAIFAGRIDILYALGRHYLSLPFRRALRAGHADRRSRTPVLPLMPLLLQITVVIAAEQLTTAYRKRDPPAAIRITGRGVIPSSRPFPAPPGAWRAVLVRAGRFPAQAYLSLAFLGMTATEFIARSAHRPAYSSIPFSRWGR